MDLHQLSAYNAWLTKYPEISPSEVLTSTFESILYYPTSVAFGRKPMAFAIAFVGDRKTRQENQSRFYRDLSSTFTLDDLTYEGKVYPISAETASEGVEEVTYQGKVQVYRSTVRTQTVGSATTITTDTYKATPVTLTISGAGTITGFTKDPIVTTGAVIISDIGEVKLSDGSNGFEMIQHMSEFPKLHPGVNEVGATVSTTVTWKELIL